MNKSKQQLEVRVTVSARNLGISAVLFRHAIGDMLGLNVTDMECLGVLYFKGLSSPSELAEYTGLSPSATTAMLDRLEKSGLIERRPNPRDRRGTLIVIMKAAAKKIEPLFLSGRQAQDDLIASYDERELKVLAEYFERSAAIYDAERKRLQP